jgi:hypothetical protein
MNRTTNLFGTFVFFFLLLMPEIVCGQNDSAYQPDHNLKLNAAPLFTPFLNWPIPSLHYEHQIGPNLSMHFGGYFFVWSFGEVTKSAGVNINYRYYFSKTPGLKGIYLSSGLNYNRDFKGEGIVPPFSFRPAIGFQDTHKQWVYDFGFGMNFRLLGESMNRASPFLIMGVGYRLKKQRLRKS